MNTPLENSPPSGQNKALWAVVGVLGVAVLAMGATLIRIQSQPTEPRTVVLPALPPTAASAPETAQTSAPALVVVSQNTASAPQTAAEPAPLATPEKAQASTVKKTTTHPTTAHKPKQTVTTESSQTMPSATPQPVQPQDPEPAVARAPAKPVCTNCGTVESVTPVEIEGAGSGVGVIAGGVLGAVVGNQVGGGDGKTLATILGAVGGGLAGNTVEKKMKKVTHYKVTVRMEDGSSRTVQQSTPASVGMQVTVDGNTLRPANR